MRINKTQIKTQQADTAQTNPESMIDIESQQTQEIQDFFDSSYEATSNSSSHPQMNTSDPLDDYTMGDFVNGQRINSQYQSGSQWLESFPPALEDVIANSDHAVNHLDIVKSQYERSDQAISALLTRYIQAKNAGGLSMTQIQTITERIELATKAKSRCQTELQKLTNLEKQFSHVYEQERLLGKDLNNDGWMGKPHAVDSYLIKYDSNDQMILIDPVTKKPVPIPFLNPDYSPALTTDNSLEMKVLNENDSADLVLGLTDDAFSNANSHLYRCAIELNIPEVLWVEKNDDYQSALGPYKIIDDDNSGLGRYKPSAWSSDSNNGIHQVVPEDKSKYIQIQVTDAQIISVESGEYDANTNEPLYHQVLELRHDSEVISRIRIEGMYDNNNDDTRGAPTLRGRNYIAASSVGVAINGNNRASAIRFDAGQMKSTGRHIASTSDLKNIFPDMPNSDAGKRAYNEHLELFTQSNPSAEYYDMDSNHPGWKTSGHREILNDPNNGHHALHIGPNQRDRYISSEVIPGKNDSALGFRTGVFIDGLRGEINGSSYNDIIRAPNVNDYSDTAKSFLPDNIKKIEKDDPLYSNIITSQGGNDIVIAGGGDNYIQGATFVHIEATSVLDENYINPPNTRSEFSSNQGSNSKRKNPKVYVHVDGGQSVYVNTPDEFNEYDETLRQARTAIVGDEDEDNEHIDENTVLNNLAESYEDDYFELNASRNFRTMELRDGETPEFANYEMGGLTDDVFFDKLTQVQKNMQDAFIREPDIDDAEIESTWQEVVGEKTKLDDEMNGFFDEMFGSMDDLFNELDID